MPEPPGCLSLFTYALVTESPGLPLAGESRDYFITPHPRNSLEIAIGGLSLRVFDAEDDAVRGMLTLAFESFEDPSAVPVKLMALDLTFPAVSIPGVGSSGMSTLSLRSGAAQPMKYDAATRRLDSASVAGIALVLENDLGAEQPVSAFFEAEISADGILLGSGQASTPGAPSMVCSNCALGDVACGPQAPGMLSDTDCKLNDGALIEGHRFRLEAPSHVRFDVESGEFVPFLAILSESCFPLAANGSCEPGDFHHACLEASLGAGTYYLGVSTSSAFEAGSYTWSFTCEPLPAPFVRGDVNSDGTIDISDAIAVLQFLFTGGEAPHCMDAADSADEGAIVITSAIRILQWLFTGGEAPLPPSPSSTNYSPGDCGPDPTPTDSLDCATSSDVCR